MKKLFLFTCLSALALSFNSCSNDDDNNNDSTDGTTGSVTFKVNGVAKTYNTVTVNEESETYGGETYEWITVTASENGSSSEYIQFDLTESMVGADALEYFEYVESNQTYQADWDTFNLNTLTNNADKVRGTFSGSVSYWTNNSEDEVIKTITEGSFDINR